jgi:hypothetical protein
MSKTPSFSRRRAVIVAIMLVIAAVHIVRVGSSLPGEYNNLWYSYFSDFILPFGCYFLLCLSEEQMPVLRRWEVKWAFAFLLPSIMETCQYFGLPVLGATFDPLDYFMYALGATSAVLVERLLFSRLLNFWDVTIA